MHRGAVYLVDFGKRYQNNLGKVRPAVVLPSQSYLDVVSQLQFPSILVFPLTTQCSNNPNNLLRVPIEARDRLHRQSEIIVNWSCSVDLKNIHIAEGSLVKLSMSELKMLEQKFALYCGLSM